ncbi:MAG: hypothetical protein QNI91_09890 [Arenicellales bacterium]|nr:hypothetical protein [Arenicellales bacterium]
MASVVLPAKMILTDGDVSMGILRFQIANSRIGSFTEIAAAMQ